MDSPHQPHGQPPQPGFPPQQPVPGQPGPQQPFQQAPFPQQPGPAPGKPPAAPNQTLAHLAGAVSIITALIGVYLGIGFVKNAIGTTGPSPMETNPGVTDALYWITSALGVLTAVSSAVAGVLFFARKPAAWILAVVTGGLGLGTLLMQVATSMSDQMNNGFGIRAVTVQHTTLFVLSLVVLVLGVLPGARAALRHPRG
ncbi:hypothetical protein [Saccharopolyspora rosea]|uniref:Integral membrane protein n=1 Tax=Saccharopolyspora rosea TaxID=524884 RepID=A0ABW3FJA6_9PSEU|nr:hypothetical protein [Saccharopolyspora rosea]